LTFRIRLFTAEVCPGCGLDLRLTQDPTCTSHFEDVRQPSRAEPGTVSANLTQFSIGDYIAITVGPVIMLAVWLIAIFHSDRHPEWRRRAPDQHEPAFIGPDGSRLGRAIPAPLPVPVRPMSPDQHQGQVPKKTNGPSPSPSRHVLS
jgi:hypothetical protein